MHTPQLLNAVRSIVSSPEQADQALSIYVFLLQWSAIILSTLSGLYSARKHGMDFYGAMVIGFIVAVGGGTIRDLLLGRFPIFWLNQPVYVVSVLLIDMASIFIGEEAQRSQAVATKIAQPVERLADEQSMAFITIDSLALGLWAYLGSLYAIQMGTPPVVAPLLGVITASFGGVLRDVFFARVPQTFMPGQLYASAAAAGAIVYVLLWALGVGSTVSFLACFVLTFVIRMMSVMCNIQSR